MLSLSPSEAPISTCPAAHSFAITDVCNFKQNAKNEHTAVTHRGDVPADPSAAQALLSVGASSQTSEDDLTKEIQFVPVVWGPLS